MKFVRSFGLVLGVVLASSLTLSLSWSAVYSHLIRPYEIHQSITNGCETFTRVHKAKSYNLTDKEQLVNAFSRTAQLDPRYIPIAKASAMSIYRYGTDKSTSTIIFSIIEEDMLVTSFCGDNYGLTRVSK